jgi:acylphosphatase
MKNAGPILGIVLVLAVGACVHTFEPSTASIGRSTRVAPTCPLAQLHNLDGSVTNTPDGVAITFTGPHDDLDQIRSNVRAMQAANNRMGDAFRACPCGRAPSAGAAEAQGGRTAMQPTPRRPIAAVATVQEIPTGAVLRLTAKNRGEIGFLRSEARENVQGILTTCRQAQ